MSRALQNTEDATRIAFQGEPGAYSHLACREVFPDLEAVACETFDDAFEAVEDGTVDLAMIPIENSTAGRVADIHILLPHKDLSIIAEHFLPVRHALMATKDSSKDQLTHAYSHVQALHQCRFTLRDMGLAAVHYADTAGAARYVAETGDPSAGAIASALAAEIYDLKILNDDVMDKDHNTTRFVILSKKVNDPAKLYCDVMTSILFEVKNIPAALYKAMGGFATNGVNITKLESYQRDGSFAATEFYAEIEGCELDENVKLAMEELRFQTKRVRLLGTYPCARKRHA